MRKLLITLSALASIIGAGVASFLVAAPLAYLTPSSGCGEASQLLNCINAQVYAVITGGVGQTRPVSIGSFGTVADNAANTVTLNTQGGVATYTGLTVAANAVGNLAMNNSLVTAASACLANVNADSASALGSTGWGLRVLPGAGTLNFLIRNTGVNSTGATNVSISFWCAN